jgi:ATP-binding cassette, subfamily B, bacterial
LRLFLDRNTIERIFVRMSLKEYRHFLKTYLAAQLTRVLLLTALLCGDIVLQLVNPQLLRIFIDAITTPG